jgi:hypothetical protein
MLKKGIKRFSESYEKVSGTVIRLHAGIFGVIFPAKDKEIVHSVLTVSGA